MVLGTAAWLEFPFNPEYKGAKRIWVGGRAAAIPYLPGGAGGSGYVAGTLKSPINPTDQGD